MGANAMYAENSTADPLQSKPALQAARRSYNRMRPAEPYPEFPLTAHPTGRWCEKIRGRIHYFGSRDDTNAALSKYLESARKH